MEPLLLAPVLMAVVLVVSGIEKLRSPQESAEAFTQLRLPAWLQAPFFARALPWVEIGLAVVLLVTPRPLGVVAAIGVLVLMAAYTAIIARALGFEEQVSCNCFGVAGAATVTGRTLARNIVLVVVAALAVLATVLVPVGVVHHLLVGPASAWGWLLGAAVAALVAVLITSEGAGSGRAAAPEAAAAATTVPQPAPGGAGMHEAGAGVAVGEAGEVLDYVRLPIPFADVELGDGTRTTLRQLAGQGAQLLLFVHAGCGFCHQTVANTPKFREMVDPVHVRVVTNLSPDQPEAWPEQWREEIETALYDPHNQLGQLFSTAGNPAAVLLGGDGLLAGGPVAGKVAIEELVEEMAEQLHGVA